MEIINIRSSSSMYDILIGKNILNEINRYLEEYDKILILSNTTIMKLYNNMISNEIEKKENTYIFEIEDGEEYKNIETVLKIYDFMIENNFSRKSVVVSFGGGVICDIGGYTAATFMRGIDFIQVPTTLLAQVDASIGGKTAVDHPKGKNLIGVIKQPKLVLVDIRFIDTLSKKDFSSGMSEVIKYSLIEYSRSPVFFNFLFVNRINLLNKKEEHFIEMIKMACLVKKYYVEIDEFEKGERAYLNLGHTYGHALETIYHYKSISHGEAVAKGIIFEMYLSNLDEEFIEKIVKMFKGYKINPYPVYFDNELIIQFMKNDKKNSHGKINFILFDKDFNLYKGNIEENEIKNKLSQFKNRYIKGIIDIGTNSCRLFLAQIKEEKNKLKIENEILKVVEIVKLGEDVNQKGFLKEDAIERTILCLKEYKKIADSYGCQKLIAFATSATRDSSNKDIFLNKVRSLGIDIRCISGETEARLNFLGNALVFDKEIMVLDIGGGSTEFSIGTSNSIEMLKSINIGAVRVTEKFFKNDNYSIDNIDNCIKWIKEKLNDLPKFDYKKYTLVGVAGTATTQVSVIKKMVKYDSKKVHLSSLNIKDIEKNLRLYLSKNLPERKNIVGLEEKRADVIIGGTIILITIMKYFGIDEIIVSESDNLNGAMVVWEERI